MAEHSDPIADDSEDGDLDPRVKIELEKLNAATDGINHLETEFGEAQALFRQMVGEATSLLEFTAKKIGAQNIAKARPYFDGVKRMRKAGYNLHQAAISYEMAQNHHTAAKERVSEAEHRAFSNSSGKLDPALQETLNQVTIEMMDATKAKGESWQKHQHCAKVFHDLQKQVTDIQKTSQKQINKAKRYFELKMTLNKSLEQQKERVEKIQEGISFAKEQYARTLKKLELISDDIHQTRRKREEDLKILATQTREEGVGAESCSESESPVREPLPKPIPQTPETDHQFVFDRTASITRGIEYFIFSKQRQRRQLSQEAKWECDSQNNLILPRSPDGLKRFSLSETSESSESSSVSFRLRPYKSCNDLNEEFLKEVAISRSSSVPNKLSLE